jgi:hypothetical protein
MKDFFRRKTLIIALGIIIASILISAFLAFFDFKKLDLSYKIVHAASGGNVFGWAWSENIGWVSFNCDHTTDGTLSPNNINTCATSGYSVDINEDGNFSGYAWSSNVGWIDFMPTADLTTYPDCGYPSIPCQTVKHSADAVAGWAKILSLEDDGWLKMRKGTSDSGDDYGVSINSSGDFSGWAWNGGGIGWVSFNAKDCDTNGNNFLDIACGGDDTTTTYIDYKVHADLNTPPTATNLTAPNNNPCTESAFNTYLKWNFNDTTGDTESAYQIIFDDDPNLTDPLFDTGKCDSSKTDPYNGLCRIAPGADRYPAHTQLNLSSGTQYYWWVKVWDDKGAESVWAESSFTTYLHEFPEVDFSLSPSNPSKDEEVTFSDNSFCYDADSTCNSWEWTIVDATLFNEDDPQNPIYKFTSSGSKNVTLKVTDDDDYYCDKSGLVNVNVALPTWKETKK